ncbi:MAG: AMP-binding protein, partial [Pseudomonadota bacterium]
MSVATTAHIDTFARDHLPPREQWPELIFELPELNYPARLNCAAELLDGMVAAGHGERIALRTSDGVCTYRQLLVRANRIAHVLRRELQLAPGNRVLLRGPNNPMLAACWFAVLKAGCIAVATMPLLRARELVPIIDKARIGAALCDVRLLEELELARQ